MPKINRKSTTKRGGRRAGSSRSAAGRKGGMATLRSRGPEFYSEIGRKGGKSRGKSRRVPKQAAARGPRGKSTQRGGSRPSRAKGR